MPEKTPKMTLIDYRMTSNVLRTTDNFKIESLKNTTAYVCGAFISKKTVNDLINVGWNIIIKEKK